MYRVYYYLVNRVKSQDFNTIGEAFVFWQKLPFESFREMRKL